MQVTLLKVICHCCSVSFPLFLLFLGYVSTLSFLFILEFSFTSLIYFFFIFIQFTFQFFLPGNTNCPVICQFQLFLCSYSSRRSWQEDDSFLGPPLKPRPTLPIRSKLTKMKYQFLNSIILSLFTLLLLEINVKLCKWPLYNF